MPKGFLIIIIIAILAMMWTTRDKYGYETSVSNCGSAAECSNDDGWTW